jgi:hypothetical protein
VPPETTNAVAAKLTEAGYDGLFLTGRQDALDSVWREGENEPGLQEIARGETYPDLTRVLAAEVLRAKDAQDGSPAELYVRALALTGLAEDRAPDFMGNAWGFMYDADRRGGDTYGSLGPRLIDAGDAAVPALARLLDDSRRMLYVGSQDATLGNSLGYRVKDAAAYYIGKIRGVDVPFHDSPQERDAEIDRLRAAQSL